MMGSEIIMIILSTILMKVVLKKEEADKMKCKLPQNLL
jgi:hypothetical protein